MKKTVIIDVFGTAVNLPWETIEESYFLLDGYFKKYNGCNTPFHELKKTIDLIAPVLNPEKKYDLFSQIFGIDRSFCQRLQKKEEENLLKYCRPRLYMRRLFQQAQARERRVIFINRGFAENQIADRILKKCGYLGVYELIEEKTLITDYENIVRDQGCLYFGNIDILRDRKKKFVCIPNTLSVLRGEFNKKILCENALRIAVGNQIHYEKIKMSPGFVAMQKIVADKFFDNPFKAWEKDSLFNRDAYFAGYYVLGMHVVGVVKWLAKEAVRHHKKRILFCARDGYLIKRIYDSYRIIFPELPQSLYIQASRKSLLPMLLKSKTDFYAPPGMFFHLYTPEKVLLFFWEFTYMSDDYDFMHVSYKRFTDNCRKELAANGFIYDQRFRTREEFIRFTAFFLKNYYSEEKHRRLLHALKDYYKTFTVDDILFDSGYSGRLAAAIAELSSGLCDVLYLYTDEEHSEFIEKESKISITSFYHCTPCIDNVLREYIISENGPTCLGILKSGEKVIPVFETTDETYKRSEAIIQMQKGAIDFASTLLSVYGREIEKIPFKPQEVSLPFEGFLRNIVDADIEMFSNTYQEDYCTGDSMECNWGQYYRQLTAQLPDTVLSWREENEYSKRGHEN